MQEFLPCRRQSGEARNQKNGRQRHPEACSVARAPAQGCENQEIDRSIFEKVDAVGKQRDRPDAERDRKFDSEIGEVERGHQPDGPVQISCHVARCRLFGYRNAMAQDSQQYIEDLHRQAGGRASSKKLTPLRALKPFLMPYRGMIAAAAAALVVAAMAALVLPAAV